jgi:hypothetical protein
MADEKLPARTQTPGLPEVPQSSSLLGRIKSAFRSRLNRRTILDNTPEAEVYRLYLEELERLPEAMLKKDRAVEHYLQHRDEIIENDHQEHQRRMDKEWARRKIEAEEDIHQIKIARLRRQEQLSKAKTKAERARFVLDTFTATAPHNKDSKESRSRKDAADAALDMLAVLQTLMVDEEADDASATSRPRTLEDDLAYIEKLIDECQSTATPEQMYLLYNIRAQLKSRVEEEKNRPS